MTNQPKPATGEWTVEGKAIWQDTQPVGVAESGKEAKLIADAHNAALAAEKDVANTAMSLLADAEQQLAAEKRARLFSEHDLIAKFDQQLAAEREKVKEGK